jgi:cobalt-zinc-cadmium efflux system protein
VLIGLWVLPRAWTLLRDSLNILLEGVPSGVALEDVEKEMLAARGVVAVHDLHVWAVTSGKAVLTAHVIRDDADDQTDGQLQAQLRERLVERFAIGHTTIQVERERCEGPDCRHDDELKRPL